MVEKSLVTIDLRGRSDRGLRSLHRACWAVGRACPLMLMLVFSGCSPAVSNRGHSDSSTPAAQDSVAPHLMEVRVAAASDLKYALDEIVMEFERTHPGIHVTATYGASGGFYSQLSNRAPFDVFLSADKAYPLKLSEQGLTLPGSEFSYARGHLVLWVLAGSSFDVEQRGIETVLDPAIRKIAIANPRHAPYGRAAESALKSMRVYDRIEQKLVFGENVAQTAQFVETSAAEIGLIARSLSMAPSLRDKGRSWPVPETSHPPLEQGGVILKWVRDRSAAEAFRGFLISRAGRSILESYGFASAD